MTVKYYFDGKELDVDSNDLRSYGLGDLTRVELMKEVLDCENYIRILKQKTNLPVVEMTKEDLQKSLWSVSGRFSK